MTHLFAKAAIGAALALLGLGCLERHRAEQFERPLPDASAIEQARRRFEEHRVRGAVVILLPAEHGNTSGPPRRLVIESGDDASARMLPASTFKIPNVLIGLETGAIAAEETFRWDGQPRGMKEWEQDLRLAEAFRFSCVPCFQELARRVGPERMREFLRRLDYGNGEMGEVIDRFWLEGPLAISVHEEAEFVRRVFLEELPFKRESLHFVKAAMKVEDAPGYRLFAKTGWATRVEPHVGWYVGWLETREGPVFFASRVLVEAHRPKVMAAVRKQLTIEILADLGLIPVDRTSVR